MQKILRQGDVLLVQVAKLPKAIPSSSANDIILAHGEATGHAHRIRTSPKHARLWDAGAERFLQVMDTVALRHEEHSPITIDPGIYRVVIQSEYTPRGLMSVAD